jgi:hypothetical protein
VQRYFEDGYDRQKGWIYFDVAMTFSQGRRQNHGYRTDNPCHEEDGAKFALFQPIPRPEKEGHPCSKSPS